MTKHVEDFTRIYMIKQIGADPRATDQVYIGRTSTNLKNRLGKHKRNAKFNHRHKLAQAMRAGGIDSWEIILLDIVPRSEEKQTEKIT